jgi:hypothetical protein
MSDLTDKLNEVTAQPIGSHNERAIRDLLTMLVKAYAELRADHLALIKKVNAKAAPKV